MKNEMGDRELAAWIVGGALAFVVTLTLMAGYVGLERTRIKADARVAVAQEIGEAVTSFADALKGDQ